MLKLKNKKINARRPTPRRLAAGRRRGAPEKTGGDEAPLEADASDTRETDAGEGEEPTANAARPPT
jgi:hypothetical protein